MKYEAKTSGRTLRDNKDLAASVEEINSRIDQLQKPEIKMRPKEEEEYYYEEDDWFAWKIWWLW